MFPTNIPAESNDDQSPLPASTLLGADKRREFTMELRFPSNEITPGGWLAELREKRGGILYAAGRRPSFLMPGGNFCDSGASDVEAFHIVARSAISAIGMNCLKIVAGFGSFLAALSLFSGSARAADISGTIATTLTIMENSRLVDDVTCTVTEAPCIAFGAPSLTLDLNGYSITGLADVATTCSSGPTTLAPPAVEDGIDFNAQANGAVRGPGVVQLFRGPGIFSLNTDGVTVTGVTTANNCMSGILIGGGSGHTINNNISIRNGNRTQPCGGI